MSALIGLAACSWLDSPAGPSIAGEYMLSAVDGQALPCCAQLDSASGDRVTTLYGKLSLGGAAPENFVATPAGLYPASCVHEVPSGTTVSGSDVPRCGDGDFSITIVQRVDHTGGRTDTTIFVQSGRYAWSDRDAVIKLVDVPMLGSVSFQARGPRLQLQRANVMGEYGPSYIFDPVPRIQ